MNITHILIVVLITGISITGCEKRIGDAFQPETKTLTGTGNDDIDLTTEVKSALLKDRDLKNVDINVETRKGIVQLSGFVDNQRQMDRAKEITKRVEGVNNVDNKIRIKPKNTTSMDAQTDDSLITSQVKAALFRDPTINNFVIKVITREGEVQLMGFVQDQTQTDRIVEVAREVDGVKNVINDQMSSTNKAIE